MSAPQPAPQIPEPTLRRLAHADSPLLALGMASVVVGLIGLTLFFLPILGLPICGFGILFGVAGFIAALFSGGSSLRWSLGGLAISCLALSVNLAMYSAPEGYVPQRAVPKPWQTISKPLYPASPPDP